MLRPTVNRQIDILYDDERKIEKFQHYDNPRDIAGLFQGIELTISHSNHRGHHERGVVYACVLTAFNCARVILGMERSGLHDQAFLEGVMSDQTYEEIKSICVARAANLHLEVEEIHELPIFRSSLLLNSTYYNLPTQSNFRHILADLQKVTSSSAAVIISRAPEVITCFKLSTSIVDVFMIFDSQPRPAHPDGSGMTFNISPDVTAEHLNNLFPVDRKLVQDDSIPREAQLLANYSAYMFVSPEPSDEGLAAEVMTALLNSSLKILDLQSKARSLKGDPGVLRREIGRNDQRHADEQRSQATRLSRLEGESRRLQALLGVRSQQHRELTALHDGQIKSLATEKERLLVTIAEMEGSHQREVLKHQMDIWPGRGNSQRPEYGRAAFSGVSAETPHSNSSSSQDPRMKRPTEEAGSFERTRSPNSSTGGATSQNGGPALPGGSYWSSNPVSNSSAARNDPSRSAAMDVDFPPLALPRSHSTHPKAATSGGVMMEEDDLELEDRLRRKWKAHDERATAARRTSEHQELRPIAPAHPDIAKREPSSAQSSSSSIRRQVNLPKNQYRYGDTAFLDGPEFHVTLDDLNPLPRHIPQQRPIEKGTPPRQGSSSLRDWVLPWSYIRRPAPPHQPTQEDLEDDFMLAAKMQIEWGNEENHADEQRQSRKGKMREERGVDQNNARNLRMLEDYQRRLDEEDIQSRITLQEDTSHHGQWQVLDNNSALATAAALQREFEEEDRQLQAERLALTSSNEYFQVFQCGICLEEHALEYVARVDGCDHQFCRECMRGYIVSKLGEHRFPITCPGCAAGPSGESTKRGEITQALVEQISIPEKLFGTFNELQMNPISILIHCRKCNQSLFVDRKEYEESPIIECPLPTCNHMWCKNCQQEVQGGGTKHTCDGTAEFDHLMRQQKWKRCPGCQTPIQKEHGCNHMTCVTPGCNSEFCYSCGEPWRQTHACR